MCCSMWTSSSVCRPAPVCAVPGEQQPPQPPQPSSSVGPAGSSNQHYQRGCNAMAAVYAACKCKAFKTNRSSTARRLWPSASLLLTQLTQLKSLTCEGLQLKLQDATATNSAGQQQQQQQLSRQAAALPGITSLELSKCTVHLGSSACAHVLAPLTSLRRLHLYFAA